LVRDENKRRRGLSMPRKIAFAALTLILGMPLTPAHAQNLSNARGIYVYSEHPENTLDGEQVQQSLQIEGVSGLTLLVGWNNVENGLRADGSGRYAWDADSPAGSTNTLDQFLGEAIAAGRKVDLAIRAGQDTPCWLFPPSSSTQCSSPSFADATPLTFVISALQGAGNCNVRTLAAPWDPVFLREWKHMLAAVAAHLQTEYFPDANGRSVRAWDAISSVRLTGVNRTTAETRLPAEILPGCVSPYANSVAIWLAAGYRPSRLLSAWDAITDDFQRYFPGKVFTMPIIPDASGNPADPDYPFPQIDENGCIYVPPVDPANFSVAPGIPAGTCTNANFPDDNAPLLQLASQKFRGELIVAYQSLINGDPAEPYVAVTAPQQWGVMTGFQTNDFFGPFKRAACSGGTNTAVLCQTSQDYLALLEIGIFPTCPVYSPHRIPPDEPCRTHPRSQYIEALPPDVSGSTDPSDLGPGYPDAIRQANAELVDYTPPLVTARPTAITPWPPTGSQEQITIAGKITDDLSGVAPGTAQFSVRNIFGAVQLEGPITVNADGSYSFTFPLAVHTVPTLCVVIVSARDYAGNTGSAVTVVPS
jgi:hypothetical protein